MFALRTAADGLSIVGARSNDALSLWMHSGAMGVAAGIF
jgi:hypothetical protein